MTCLVLACTAAREAHAQESTTTATGAPDAPLPAAEAIPQPQPETTPSVQAAPAPIPDSGVAKLELNLKAVNDERAHTTNLVPWLTVGIGAAAVVVGASVGAGYALDCDQKCESPNWVTFAVVGGATVATLGAIWVLHRDADIRELESQRYQLEQELMRVRLSRPMHDNASAGARSAISWRFTL